MKDLGTGEVFSYSNQGTPSCSSKMEKGVRRLMEADRIIGHNIIGFDVPALTKVHPWFNVECRDGTKVVDTLALSQLIWSDLSETDWNRIRSGQLKMPGSLAGRHRLEAWGYRLVNYKGHYGVDGWDTWSPEMQEYCEQDVDVTEALWRLIESKDYSPEAMALEHRMTWILREQERNGYGFDIEN